MWHHIQYACYQNNSLGHYTPLCITSHPLYLWHHIQYVRYHHTDFMKTQRLYRHLTRHIWHHSHCFCVITQTAQTSVSTYHSMLISQHVCKSSHLAHVWHHTQSTSHHIHTIWHEWSCFMTSHTRNTWHQIFSIWHHIHSLGHHTTFCMTSSPLYLSSRPLHLCHHTQPIDDITATT